MVLLSCLLYLIVIATLLVQSLNSARWNNNYYNSRKYEQGIKNPAIFDGFYQQQQQRHQIADAFPLNNHESKRDNSVLIRKQQKQFVSNKNDVFNKNNNAAAFITNTQKKTGKMKSVLERVLHRIGLKKRRGTALQHLHKFPPKNIQDVAALNNNNKENRIYRRGGRGDKKVSRSSVPVWGKWTEWSHCSVSCGKGRHIRWKRCVEHCDGIETEMEEKTCQLPACGSTLFGLIHL